MSARQIIELLEKLVALHKSFNQLAKKKTDILKASDTEALSVLLVEEQKHIKAINQTDQEREAAVERFLTSIGAGQREASLSTVTEYTDPMEAATLANLKDKLLQEVEELKEQNSLNQQLIYQSLQFINVSLNMMRPQKQNMNYGKTAKKAPKSSLGMFDSKA